MKIEFNRQRILVEAQTDDEKKMLENLLDIRLRDFITFPQQTIIAMPVPSIPEPDWATTVEVLEKAIKEFEKAIKIEMVGKEKSTEEKPGVSELPKEIKMRINVPAAEEVAEALKVFVGKLGSLEVIVEGKQVPVTEKAIEALTEFVKRLLPETEEKPSQKPEEKPAGKEG